MMIQAMVKDQALELDCLSLNAHNTGYQLVGSGGWWGGGQDPVPHLCLPQELSRISNC